MGIKTMNIKELLPSFPTRERGLKFVHTLMDILTEKVVPHAGTWIEIHVTFSFFVNLAVVPHAGTWIEISMIVCIGWRHASFPTRECGLK